MRELRLDAIFLEVNKPARLVSQHTDHRKRKGGPPTSQTTVTLEDLGGRTRWTRVARFDSLAERDAAVGMGFTSPIEASNERLVAYLRAM